MMPLMIVMFMMAVMGDAWCAHEDCDVCGVFEGLGICNNFHDGLAD
jgi:hypothetical protein